jgi:hypothetical protein
MNEPSSRDAPRRLALSVEGVEVLPTDLNRFLVRVAGAWEPGSGRPGGRAELVLLAGDEELRFPALPETSGAAEKAAPEAEAFRATFSVPESLGASLAGPLRLAVGEVVVELPAARLPGETPDPPSGATVIDRAVLAERRARRAELAEEANARRAEDAEVAVRDLEAELAKLEVRLEQAVADRALADARRAESEREARAATQREFAERRRREETSEEASARLHEAERAASDSRSRLRNAEARAAGLAREGEELRRRAAETEHALAAAEAARGRAERLAAELGEWMETADADGAQLAAGGALSGRAATTGAETASDTAMSAFAPAELLRSEAALARRSLTVFTAPAPPPPDTEPVARALDAVEETEQRVRAVAEAVQRMTRDVRGEREARGRAERRAAELEREQTPELREFVSTAAEALRQAERRIEEAQSAATDLSARIEQLESQLTVERAARAEAEAARVAAEAASTQAPASAPEVARPEPAPAEPAPAEPAAPEAPPPTPWLPAALRLMVRRAPIPATQLLFELLAGQALNVSGPLEYRLCLEGEQPRSVSLSPGRARIAPLAPDASDDAAFQVTTNPAGLLELLMEGGSRKLRRRVRVSGTWRRRRALRSIPPAELRPGALVAAKVWVDAVLVLRALTQLVDSAWTEGHEFVVAHEIEGRRPQRLWIRAASGSPLAILPTLPREPVDVTVLSTHSTFLRYLGGEPNGPERWTIRGDVNALAVLTGWLDRARART